MELKNVPNPSPAAERAPRRILVVDDNEANLDIARMRLESQGYEVVTALDGEEALARVREILMQMDGAADPAGR